jgi:hypothetical protein
MAEAPFYRFLYFRAAFRNTSLVGDENIEIALMIA